MAALQKIRSKGILLIIIIGVGLFAFIAEEFFRSIETTANESKQQVGEVYGETISSQDFQKMLESYEDALKFMRGISSLSDEESTQAKDYVWQMYVNYKLISHEAQKLGLTVTDGELQEVLNEGTNPVLAQTPFRNEKTGRFDVNMLKNFLQEYEKMQSNTAQVPQQYMEYYTNLFNFWKFIEKNLRENLLEQKYQVLLYKSILSNPIEAKMNYEGTVNRNNLMLASVPYTVIPDGQVQITDADLKAKYESTKELYRQFIESRDIKYVSVAVKASTKDKADLDKDMASFATKMATSSDIASVVRMSSSTVPYSNIPRTKKSLPEDIQGKLDSIAVGVIHGPYYNASDNSDNIIKILSKVQAPDSIQYRQIQVGGQTADDAHKRADSIYTALKAGADFEALAKRYNQKGDKQWISSDKYESGTLDEDNAKFITALNTLAAGQTENLSFAQGNVILQIMDRKAMTTKYNVAVIKRPVEFSKETYSKAYNNFSHYLATSTTLKAMETNAPKFGYSVETHNDLYSSEHYVGNATNTREAMKWVFAAKDGDISPLYECGENDHLLVVVLMKTHKAGYRPFEDVKDQVRTAVMRDKKADMLIARLKSVKSIAAARGVQGAIVDSLNDVCFNIVPFVKATGITEPVLSGSVWNHHIHDFVGPVKGNNGVYLYEILSTTKQNIPFNEMQYEQAAMQEHMRSVSNFGSDLYLDGKVLDKRYLFF